MLIDGNDHVCRARSFSEREVFHISEQIDPARDQVLACEDLQLVWNEPRHHFASFKTYFWWDILLHNAHYEDTLANVLGRDHMGVIRAWEQLSPLLFRPVPEVNAMVAAVDGIMRPGAYRLGVHVRMGNAWYDQADADCKDLMDRGGTGTCTRTGERRMSDLPVHTARCAVGVVPQQERSQPLVWVLVSDSAQAKSIARYFITDVEGGEAERFQFARGKPAQAPTGTAAGQGGRERRDGGATAGESVGGEDAAIRGDYGISAGALEWLQALLVKVYSLKSGSQIVVIDRPVNRSSAFDMQVLPLLLLFPLMCRCSPSFSSPCARPSSPHRRGSLTCTH